MTVPIDPSFTTISPEWQIGSPAAPAEGGESFGGMLSDAIASLEKTQSEAAVASQELATGKVEDPTQVIMAVERARLSMELAAQVRNKAVEAYQEIFRTQV